MIEVDDTVKTLTLAAIGCGGRTRIYVKLAARIPEHYRVVAAADPRSERLHETRELSGNPDFQCYRDADELLAQPKLADIMIIGTQDADHREHAIRAMQLGYDLLLEKPIATHLEDILAVERAAQELGRRVLVCHVLRYTPFYQKIKELLSSGVLGRVLSINAVEGVGAWHQAHSYVRGHWAETAKSSPMILAKSCHDLDILRWLVNASCTDISSFGELSHFTTANRPEGAPAYCLDGCPAQYACMYNAERYLGDQQHWLPLICDEATEESRRQWLHRSPWGRCVYQSSNDVVDHQVVSMRFANECTATFTMTAFEAGRHIEIYGTRARLRGGVFLHQSTGSDIIVTPHAPGAEEVRMNTESEAEGYDEHLGGDAGLMAALYHEMLKPDAAMMTSSLAASVESHRMALAAERSRLEKRTLSLNHDV